MNKSLTFNGHVQEIEDRLVVCLELFKPFLCSEDSQPLSAGRNGEQSQQKLLHLAQLVPGIWVIQEGLQECSLWE